MILDDIAQNSFDALNISLISAPLFHPPNYHRYCFLYLAAADTTIAMVLVQDDDDGNEHVIYCLSRNLFDIDIGYSHVEKLALAAVHTVQPFRHYILLCKTIVISDCNP